MCMFFSKEEFGGGGRVDSIYALWPSAAYTRGYFHACAYVMEHCILFCEQLMLMIKGFIQNQLNQEKENKNSLVLG